MMAKGKPVRLSSEQAARLAALTESLKEIDKEWSDCYKKIARAAGKFKAVIPALPGWTGPVCPDCQIPMPYRVKHKAHVCPMCEKRVSYIPPGTSDEAQVLAQINHERARDAAKGGGGASGKKRSRPKPKYQPGAAARGIKLEKKKPGN
jgi:hypothetical protein